MSWLTLPWVQIDCKLLHFLYLDIGIFPPKFGEFSGTISLNMLSDTFFLSSSWIPIICMLVLLMVLHDSCTHSLFFFLLWLNNLKCSVFEITGYFFILTEFDDEVFYAVFSVQSLYSSSLGFLFFFKYLFLYFFVKPLILFMCCFLNFI